MFDFSAPVKVDSTEAMQQLGRQLAAQLVAGDVVYLRGPLGAGKTTLAQAIVHALGFSGRVKSPSYGLLEAYPADDFEIAHLDLYRLSGPEQVLDLGLEAYASNGSVMLIEWPDLGGDYLPKANWVIEIEDMPPSDGDPMGHATRRWVTVSRV